MLTVTRLGPKATSWALIAALLLVVVYTTRAQVAAVAKASECRFDRARKSYADATTHVISRGPSQRHVRVWSQHTPRLVLQEIGHGQ